MNMHETREKLKAALVEHSDEAIEAFIEALVAAGTWNNGGDWDSETIEGVLEPMQSLVRKLGFPGVGNTSNDQDAASFWFEVDGVAVPWDPYEGNSGAALADWKREVADGDTQLGFQQWWDDRIDVGWVNS